MAVVINDPGLSPGFRAINESLGVLRGVLGNRQKQRQQGVLANTLQQIQNEGLDVSSPQGNIEFLRRLTQAGVPLAEATSAIKSIAPKQGFNVSSPEELTGLFVRLGIPQDTAESYAQLYQNLSQGGRTAFANMFIDKLQRGDTPSAMELSSVVEKDVALKSAEENEIFPKINLFQGLTPKEKVVREKELFNENAKDFSELTKSINSLKGISLRTKQLEKYNESGRLPEGLENLNINWETGNIRFPKLANTETQGFVKTVNDFLSEAKDLFGARVTDFDIKAFFRRLPSLANTTEGRRLIIDQMMTIDEITDLYNKSLKSVYDHYGLRGIDKQKAEQIAAEKRAPQEEALKEKLYGLVKTSDDYSIESLKEKLQPGSVLIEYNGKRGSVPRDQLERALSRGAIQL